ncbi:hypothetical protein FRB99_005747 [Tulasnella sp. 403]|nr:hypothetical protein FRB99_005747 [Tulasnella sp. 403]
MNSYARKIDGSIPIKAQLYESEDLIASQDSVGLYDGKDKSLHHQNGTVHVTSHRLFYIDLRDPRGSSIAMNLSNVRQTDSYAGFLTSSPKISLAFGTSSTASGDRSSLTLSEGESETLVDGSDSGHGPPSMFTEAWVCPICSFSNPPSAKEGQPKCQLCGVTRDPAAVPASSQRPILAPVPLPSTSRPQDFGLSKSFPSSPANLSDAHPPPFLRRTPPAEQSLACPTCTFINHPSMRLCEMCSTPLRARPMAPGQQSLVEAQDSTWRLRTESAPASRARTPGPEIMKISFRKGGDKAFYTALKRTLQEKAWESPERHLTETARGGPGLHSGIHGIMEAAKINTEAQNEDLNLSLKDLEALMSKAKQMVEFAQSLNIKLTAQEEAMRQQGSDVSSLSSSSTAVEEATFIRSSMARLGLPSMVVTPDMVKDDTEYHEQLAKELATILLGPNASSRDTNHYEGLVGAHNGIIGLDEVWCGWNRARGIALVPPSTLMAVLPHLPRFCSQPLHERTLKTGLRIIHIPKYTHEAFTLRLVDKLSHSLPPSTVDVARDEQVSSNLAEQMIEAVESDGLVVRDEPGGYEPTRWYLNHFKTLIYDGTT